MFSICNNYYITKYRCKGLYKKETNQSLIIGKISHRIFAIVHEAIPIYREFALYNKVYE